MRELLDTDTSLGPRLEAKPKLSTTEPARLIAHAPETGVRSGRRSVSAMLRRPRYSGNPKDRAKREPLEDRELMERAELIARAAPSCRQCQKKVQRVEIPWHLDDDGTWKLGPSFMVCGQGHRELIELL
jgi:hypothetical protein